MGRRVTVDFAQRKCKREMQMSLSPACNPVLPHGGHSPLPHPSVSPGICKMCQPSLVPPHLAVSVAD